MGGSSDRKQAWRQLLALQATVERLNSDEKQRKVTDFSGEKKKEVAEEEGVSKGWRTWVLSAINLSKSAFEGAEHCLLLQEKAKATRAHSLLSGAGSKLSQRAGAMSNCSSSCIHPWLAGVWRSSHAPAPSRPLGSGEKETNSRAGIIRAQNWQETGFQGIGPFALLGQKCPDHYPVFNLIYVSFSTYKEDYYYRCHVVHFLVVG